MEKQNNIAATSFGTALKEALNKRGTTLENICAPDDRVARRVLEEYGAMFVASSSVVVPPVCVFSSEDEVEEFQEEAGAIAYRLAGTIIELQPKAMTALLAARAEARDAGLEISPRGGAEAARRSYADTVRLWETRVSPALRYWHERGRLSFEQATRLRGLPVRSQITEVLALEEQGIFFSKDFSKTILQSVAPPGTSQHLALLAFDVAEFLDAGVRRILAAHGWFQTVRSDLPHFTFLGHDEADLPAHGLHRVEANGQTFWLPDI